MLVLGFEKFCVKCGKNTAALIHGMCTNCFLKRHDLFEMKDIRIEKCVKCKKGRVKGHWEFLSNEAIANEVATRVKLNHDLDQPKIFVELRPINENDFEATVNVEGFLEGVLVEKKMDVDFSVDKVSCDSCMKLCSNYREAIIQLRAGSQDEADAMLEVTKELLAQEAAKDSLSASIKILGIKRAYDLWVGSNKGASKVARKLAKLYKTDIICSKKLIGQEDSGKEKYRFTYCIKKK